MPFSFVSEGSSASSTPKKSTFSPEAVHVCPRSSVPSASKVLSFGLKKTLLRPRKTTPSEIKQRTLESEDALFNYIMRSRSDFIAFYDFRLISKSRCVLTDSFVSMHWIALANIAATESCLTFGQLSRNGMESVKTISSSCELITRSLAG